MALEVLTSVEACAPLRDDWNALFTAVATDIDGPGIGNCFEMTMTVWRVLCDAKPQVVVVERDGAAVTGLLAACYRSNALLTGEMTLLPDVYPGRGGLLIVDPTADRLGTLVNAVFANARGCAALDLRLVSGSELERLLRVHVDSAGVPWRALPPVASPHLDIPDDWDAFEAALPRKFRQNVRSRERKLRKEGALSLRVCSTMEDCDWFFRSLVQIEQSSWKESAGTSMTQSRDQVRFHELVAPLLAENGWLRCYVLMLDDNPIAYAFGVVVNGVCYYLKSSFVDRYKKLGPGTVIKSLIIRDLMEFGVRKLDWVGEVQPHKMEWGSEIYRMNRYRLYAPSVPGRMLCMFDGAKGVLRRVRAAPNVGRADSVPD